MHLSSPSWRGSENAPPFPHILPRSKGHDDDNHCSHVECPLRTSKNHVVEFYYPNRADREADQPGKKKQGPLSSGSWQVTHTSSLLTSAGVAIVPSYSVSEWVTRWQRNVHLEATDQWAEANTSPHYLLLLEQTPCLMDNSFVCTWNYAKLYQFWDNACGTLYGC